MKTPTGFTIPFNLAVGNHEAGNHVAGSSSQVEMPFFLRYFPQKTGLKGIEPEKRPMYHSHKISNHSLSLILDSGIVELMNGVQSSWMVDQLQASKSINKFAAYHYSLYPSITREFSVKDSDKYAWTSIFDRFNFTAAFENHYHLFKRSKPIRNNQVSADGVTYLGDGAWGITSEDIFMNPNSWWISEVSRTPHVYVVTASEWGVQINAIDGNNKSITSFTKLHKF